jgi:hypothetical protein
MVAPSTNLPHHRRPHPLPASPKPLPHPTLSPPRCVGDYISTANERCLEANLLLAEEMACVLVPLLAWLHEERVSGARAEARVPRRRQRLRPPDNPPCTPPFAASVQPRPQHLPQLPPLSPSPSCLQPPPPPRLPQGLVYLDLKPDQMIISGNPATRETVMRLVDFEAATPAAQPELTLYTLPYLPPEVRGGTPRAARAQRVLFQTPGPPARSPRRDGGPALHYGGPALHWLRNRCLPPFPRSGGVGGQR